ncbi:MAG: C25 family cysteine peptidase, partial [Thermanaerothrix sp.]|nr:C25 family cysteine peptidase [Thermanaerothrix sp.]
MLGRARRPLIPILPLLAALTFGLISPFHRIANAADVPLPRYVIVAPSEFAAALQPLLALKAAQGFQTTALTVEACGGSTAGIKTCLRAVYEADTLTPLYVLLVGATDRLPAWPSRLNPNRQTDLYYATMDGSLDYTPNFILGRLPVRSVEELSRVSAAWQAYAGLAGDEPWLRRAAFLATNHLDERLAVEATLNDLITTYTAPRGYRGGFPIPDQVGGDRLYAYTHAADRTAVRTALNEGRSLVVYLGEVALTALPGTGTLSAWKAPAFDQNDVRALKASPIPLVLSLAGRSADFTLGEPLGETWVRNADHGALVFIGATQETQWVLDRALARAFFAALFADPTPSLGQALQTALTALAADYPDDARRYWEAYTLLGDPALQPRLFSLRGDFSLSLHPTSLALCAGSTATAQVVLQ